MYKVDGGPARRRLESTRKREVKLARAPASPLVPSARVLSRVEYEPSRLQREVRRSVSVQSPRDWARWLAACWPERADAVGSPTMIHTF